MIIHAGSRRSGKTTKAIILAHATKAILIVQSSTMADYVVKEAQKMGFFVEAVSIHHYLDYKSQYRGRKIVIDELDTILREVLNGDVVMATTTGATSEHPFNFSGVLKS